MISKELSLLLKKYQDGTCTPEETTLLNQWYNKHEQKADVLDGFSTADRDALKQRMFQNIDKLITNDVEATSHKGKVLRLWLKIGAAAAVIGFIAFFLVFHKATLNPAAVQSPVQLNASNTTHKIIKKVLPDGSVVWLKPGAALSYPEQFAADSRKVSMRGEAFFEITKNPKRPFIIESKHIVTKVWGTSFQVTDNDDAQSAAVTVVTGKVSVSKRKEAVAVNTKLAADEVMLYPTQKVTYHQNTNSLITDTKADMAEVELWKHVNLSFTNSKLVDIAKVLSRQFDVDIQIANDKLKNEAMTADLTDLNLPDVLEVLKASMGIGYEINDKHIVLNKTNL